MRLVADIFYRIRSSISGLLDRTTKYVNSFIYIKVDDTDGLKYTAEIRDSFERGTMI